MGRKLKTKLPSLKKTQTSNSHLPCSFKRSRDTETISGTISTGGMQFNRPPSSSLVILSTSRTFTDLDPSSAVTLIPAPTSSTQSRAQFAATVLILWRHLLLRFSQPQLPTSPRHLPQLPDLLFPRRVRPTPVFSPR